MGKLLKACPAADLPPGASKAVAGDGGEIALFNVDGELCAIDNLCPHRGGPLSEGRVDKGVVVCPWHGWQFDVRTGALLMNPSEKQKTYKVVRQGDDLYVEI